ncbi:hypothetical protein EVAR_60686_1 [Eumeta japonica]|uniref:Uncharacterized protein n=1 Tax=Eumeta variegata TaxID=151549 RepID=A0A4C1ZLK6_EUMVA|nr:hypothetical protein EVAR_60686_1 [Eumeta japonica]
MSRCKKWRQGKRKISCCERKEEKLNYRVYLGICDGDARPPATYSAMNGLAFARDPPSKASRPPWGSRPTD